MTETWCKVCRVCVGASLLLLLSSSCASGSGDSNSGASRSDAGGSVDAGTGPQANEVAEGAGGAAAVDAGEGAANGGSGGRASSEGGQDHADPAENTGGAGAPPVTGAGGSAGTGGTGAPDQHPPSGGSAHGTGGAGENKSDDADGGTQAPDPNLVCTACGACEETMPVVSAMHTNMPVSYPDPPPTSGPHNPCWAAWGIHDEPLAPERWVHNLEHGGVVFLYNCPAGCDAELATIKDIATTRARTVVAAYDKLPKRFAVVSWGHRLVSDCLDGPAFTAFYKAHVDRAPESNAMPPNPSCPP